MTFVYPPCGFASPTPVLRARSLKHPATNQARCPAPVARFGDAAKSVAAAAAAVALVAATPQHADASIFHFRGERPSNIGVRSERYLAGCPVTPNCVSSMENVYNSHYVPSWTYNNPTPNEKRTPKTMEEAITDLRKVIDSYEGATIISQRPTNSPEVGEGYYIYCEFESKLMGFIDDVEFLFMPDGSTVEYRTASRLGRDDLKANRTRIKNIRVALMQEDNRWASTGY